MDIIIKQVEGHKMDGAGEVLGIDMAGVQHTFWSQTGHMEVPMDLAIKLENEKPKRFEIVDKDIAKDLLGKVKPEAPKVEQPIVPPKPKEEPVKLPTLAELNDLTKDSINDFCAINQYEANTRDRKDDMIKSLVQQIEKRTGIKIK